MTVAKDTGTDPRPSSGPVVKTTDPAAPLATVEECERRFDGVGQRWIDDGARGKRSDVPDMVYHYTDASGLHGMLNSDQLWLTDSRFLNDKTEGVHLIQSVGELLEELDQKESVADLKSLYTLLRPLLDKNAGYELFIFSASERKDDLSQWRGYAREGRGFTIGLDAEILYETSLPPDSEYNFSKVEYDHLKQRRMSEKIIAEMGRHLISEIAGNPHLDKADIVLEAARTLAWTIRNRRGFSKHKSFDAEREWRISAMMKQKSHGIKVRASGLGLVPYISIEPCGPGTKLPIRSIGIGPGFENAQIADAVSSLCRQNGYSPDIWFADTPYRRP